MNANPCYIDAHLHLQDETLRPDFDGVIRRAGEAHVVGMVCNGTEPADWPIVLDLAHRNPDIVPFVGLHPWRIPSARGNWLEELESIVRANACGIGEIGLDTAKPIEQSTQQEIFEAQLSLAVRFQRPVSIHCVKAWGRLVDSLRKTPLPAGFMVHAFNGSAEVARELIGMGGYVSFSALSLTENRRAKTKMLLTALPKDRILFETESPFGLNQAVGFISFEPTRPNEPANLPSIVNEAARLIGKDANTFAQTIFENASRFIQPLREQGHDR